MRGAGMIVKPHDAHFSTVPDDPTWLRFITEQGWVGLTKDNKITMSELSVRTIYDCGARLFICIGRYGHTELAQNIVRSRHKLKMFSEKHPAPFISRLYMAPQSKWGRKKGGGGDLRLFNPSRFL